MNPHVDYKLHHVGYLVDNIHERAVQFVTRFGYRIESEVIEDPTQTAFVQFLRLPGARNWLELVSPTSAESKLARALGKGGGLHHFCYEVAHLAEACEKLRNDGMLLLGAPTPAVAFGGRRIAWLIDRTQFLVELVEDGTGPFRLETLEKMGET